MRLTPIGINTKRTLNPKIDVRIRLASCFDVDLTGFGDDCPETALVCWFAGNLEITLSTHNAHSQVSLLFAWVSSFVEQR